MEVFYSKHTELVKVESANGLANVGAIISEYKEFEKYYDIIWNGYKEADRAKKEVVQGYYIKSLAAFVALKPYIDEKQIQLITTDVQRELENTQSSYVMVGLVETLVAISNWKPMLLDPIFQDVVDVIIGWHIDTEQTPGDR